MADETTGSKHPVTPVKSEEVAPSTPDAAQSTPTTTEPKSSTPPATLSSSSLVPSTPDNKKKTSYTENVLGRYVLIEFLIDVNRRAWFRGQLIKCQFTWSPTAASTPKVEHFVRFDDGDERWFTLAVEEEMGRLQWTTASSSGASLPARKGKRLSTTVTPDRKRVKTEPSDESVVAESEDEEEEEDEDEEDEDDADEANGNNEPLSYEERLSQLAKEPESAWMDDMRHWLETVPHGRVKKTVSPSNASKVMSQVSKLVAGKGITYKNWPSSVCFYGGVRITLNYDFDKLLKGTLSQVMSVLFSYIYVEQWQRTLK